MGCRSKLRKLDMFRKVPTDLTEGSTCGTALSIFCYLAVAILVAFEFNSFLAVETKTDYLIEQHNDEFIRISFDITMPKLSCEYASLDVVNQMGTHKINVTQNIRRYEVYDNGITREITPVENNPEFSTIEKMTTESFSTLIKGLDQFHRITASKSVILVNFFAPWCHWCQSLAPIYEGVAQRITQGPLQINVVIAKVDCTMQENVDVCRQNNIRAFPTLIGFTPQGETKWTPYRGIRSVEGLISFVSDLTELAGSVVDGNNQLLNITAGQDGCRLTGAIVVPRMSGNFHISCHGSHAYILPSEINVSHQVHHLSFGDDHSPYELSQIPDHIKKGMDVLRGKSYPVFTTNTSYEHILKVFPTQLNKGSELIDMFQYTSDSGMGRSDEDYPEATFSFEFDPLTIVISEVKKPFYHFITSLFAIIGGVVTVISLFDSLFNKAELIFQEKELLGKNE